MAFEFMGAITNFGKYFTVNDIKELFQSIPEFFRSINSYLPENRALRIAIYSTGVVCMLNATPYVLRHTEWFDYYYRHMDYMHRFCPLIEEQKRQLFANMVSHMDELPLLNSEFMVLEIQAGGGSNLSYYPEDTMLVATDNDLKYEQQMLQNFSNNLNGSINCFLNKVTLKRFVTTFPEELRGIPDNSMSAVVCIHALCSPIDLNRALEEIKRVLMPTGRLYFIEHVATEGYWSWRSFDQFRFIPAFAMIGCHLRRKTQEYIGTVGFSSVKFQNVDFNFTDKECVPLRSLSPHIVGYAVK